MLDRPGDQTGGVHALAAHGDQHLLAHRKGLEVADLGDLALAHDQEAAMELAVRCTSAPAAAAGFEALESWHRALFLVGEGVAEQGLEVAEEGDRAVPALKIVSLVAGVVADGLAVVEAELGERVEVARVGLVRLLDEP